MPPTPKPPINNMAQPVKDDNSKTAVIIPGTVTKKTITITPYPEQGRAKGNNNEKQN